MNICPSCREVLEDRFGSEPATVCPRCGQVTDQRGSAQWKDLARVTNLAEAGYLVNVLGGEEIAARIIETRSFNALAGVWGDAYTIQVKEDQVPAAAAIVRDEAVEADNDEELHGSRQDAQEENFDPVFWRPVALMALAGVASFALGQKMAERRENPASRPHAARLLDELERLDGPLVTESAPGEARHRITFDRPNRTWYIESDRNGDGQFDRMRVFKTIVHPRP